MPEAVVKAITLPLGAAVRPPIMSPATSICRARLVKPLQSILTSTEVEAAAGAGVFDWGKAGPAALEQDSSHTEDY